MKVSEAESAIKKAGGSVETFWKWMQGQTMGLNEDGSTDVYEYDVKRFIRYNCDPKKEPLSDWD